MGIDAYDYGMKDGIAIERQRILDWINSNRTAMELGEGVVIYRDHFSSDSLIQFIESGEKAE
jgi:hypothetical protein